jgi:hypothetical protein
MSTERALPERIIECLPASIGPSGKNARSLGDGLGAADGGSETDGDVDGEIGGATPPFPPQPMTATATTASATGILCQRIKATIAHFDQSGYSPSASHRRPVPSALTT